MNKICANLSPTFTVVAVGWRKWCCSGTTVGTGGPDGGVVRSEELASTGQWGRSRASARTVEVFSPAGGTLNYGNWVQKRLLLTQRMRWNQRRFATRKCRELLEWGLLMRHRTKFVYQVTTGERQSNQEKYGCVQPKRNNISLSVWQLKRFCWILPVPSWFPLTGGLGKWQSQPEAVVQNAKPE